MRRAQIAVLSIASLATGCGGGERLSKAEYEQKVRSLYADVQKAFRETDVRALDQLADRVEHAQQELRSAADELDDSTPPREVETENEALVDGMRDYADDLEELREAAAARDASAVEAINTRAALLQSSAVEGMAEAAEAMKFKGYDLGEIAEE